MTTITVIGGVTSTFEALTTIFTPPAACSDAYYTFNSVSNNTTYALRGLSSAGQVVSSSCWPPNFSAHHDTNAHAAYSPAVCPSGYHASGISTISDVIYSACCPSSMTRGSSYCMQGISTPTIISYTSSGLRVASTVVAQQWPVYVRWASSDLNIFTPRSAPLLGAGVTSAPLNSASTSKATGPSRSSSSKPTAMEKAGPSRSLSTDAQIGIGVGVGVGALIITVALVTCLLMQRKRRQQNGRHHAAPVSQSVTDKSEAPEQAKPPLFQLHSDSALSEADSRQPAAELPGDWDSSRIR